MAELPVSIEDIQQLEELNLNAWPSLQCIHHDGWLVRRSGGQSRRVNSANTLWRGRIALAEKVKYCETLFARWGQRPVFRITPLSEQELDPLLSAQDYVIEAPTCVQVADVSAQACSDSVRVAERFEPAWVQVSARLRGLDPDETRILSLQHAAIAVPSVWATVMVDGTPAGVGVAAIERGWAGIHGIYVSKEFRRRGLARLASEALLGYAFRRGARRAWLQVETANSRAIPLYAALGFRSAYAYHHRVPGNAVRAQLPPPSATEVA